MNYLTFSIQDLAKENLQRHCVFPRLNVCSYNKVGEKKKSMTLYNSTILQHLPQQYFICQSFLIPCLLKLARLLHQRAGVIASLQIKEKEGSVLYTICPSHHLTVTLT